MTRLKVIVFTALTGILLGFSLAGGLGRFLDEAEIALRAAVIAEQWKYLYCSTQEGARACGKVAPVRRAVTM